MLFEFHDNVRAEDMVDILQGDTQKIIENRQDQHCRGEGGTEIWTEPLLLGRDKWLTLCHSEQMDSKKTFKKY